MFDQSSGQVKIDLTEKKGFSRSSWRKLSNFTKNQNNSLTLSLKCRHFFIEWSVIYFMTR